MSILSQFRTITAAFNQAQIQYLVVGGLAVIAHGYSRLTADIDIVLNLDDSGGLERAVQVLTNLGYRPRSPVPFRDFLDPRNRQEWHDQKDMLAFSVSLSTNEHVEIDLFITLPFPFAAAWDERLSKDIGNGLIVPFVDLTRLLDMKRKSTRSKDLEDVRILSAL